MYDLKAYAVRQNGIIHVKLTGMLPNTCHIASVKDKYPGGVIRYIRDPEEAQVFIEECIYPGSSFCLLVLMPWSAEVQIPDSAHNQLGIYVNYEKVLTVEICSEPSEFQVIALAGTEELTGCSVIPSNAFFPMIYRQVFGPNSREASDAWMSENCLSRNT